MHNNHPTARIKTPPANKIYRYFFIAAIGILFTLGCMWGAINLVIVGRNESFHGVEYSWVLAHGHAMVFGFIGLFIMGFAYYALPRFKETTLWKPKLAISTLPLMVIGILMQTAAHLIAPQSPYLPIGITAGVIQLIAVITFFTIMLRTLRGTKIKENYDGFVWSALLWMLLAAILNPIIFWLFESAPTQEDFLFYVSAFNIPYRDIQTLGIAVVMILGISLRILPHAYGFQKPSKSWIRFLLWGVNGAVLFGVISFTTAMITEIHWWHAANVISYLILLIAAIGTPIQFGLFKKIPDINYDRSLKFIRAAYLWFIVAMILLTFGPYYMFRIYLPMTEGINPFSHAYFGAYRHALTVGFMMMMIVGISGKVVPAFSDVDIRKTSNLWAVFILLNLGNTWRITAQIMTDFFPEAFRFIGVSGFIELTALALWGFELIRNMRQGAKLCRGNSLE